MKLKNGNIKEFKVSKLREQEDDKDDDVEEIMDSEVWEEDGKEEDEIKEEDDKDNDVEEIEKSEEGEEEESELHFSGESASWTNNKSEYEFIVIFFLFDLPSPPRLDVCFVLASSECVPAKLKDFIHINKLRLKKFILVFNDLLSSKFLLSLICYHHKFYFHRFAIIKNLTIINSLSSKFYYHRFAIIENFAIIDLLSSKLLLSSICFHRK